MNDLTKKQTEVLIKILQFCKNDKNRLFSRFNITTEKTDTYKGHTYKIKIPTSYNVMIALEKKQYIIKEKIKLNAYEKRYYKLNPEKIESIKQYCLLLVVV